MGKTTDDIKNELGKFAGQFAPATIITAIVKVTDEANSKITVELSSGLELDDVRLRSVIKAGNKCILIPKLGTTVLIGKIESDDEYVVLAMEDIAKVVYVFGTLKMEFKEDGFYLQKGTDGTVKMEITDTGFLLQKGTETMKKIIGDLITEIKAIKVATNSGPSSIPLNIAALEVIKTRADNLLR